MSLSKSVCGFFKEKCIGFQKFLPPTKSPLGVQPEVMGTYLPGTGTLGGGPSMGLGLLTPKISLLNFYPPHVRVGPTHSVFQHLLPVWMDVVSLIPWL